MNFSSDYQHFQKQSDLGLYCLSRPFRQGTSVEILETYTIHLSYDVASGNEITPCNKICKPLVVYRFSGNVNTFITTLHTY